MKKNFTLCLLLVVLFNTKAQDLIRFDTIGKIGFKNSAGKTVARALYKYPDDFPDGLLSFDIDNKYGFVDNKGKIVIPFIYERATNFYKGFAVVQSGETVFIIDKTGKQIKKLKYNSLKFSAKDVANVGLDGKQGRIEITTGKEIIPPIYDFLDRFFSNNYSTRVRLGQKWGVINKAGVVIVPIQYDEISTFYNNSYKVQIGKKYGLIYPDLKLIPELKYDHFEEFEVEEGHFFLVKAAGKFGYINILGKEFIPLKYDFAKRFQEGYATVVKAGRWYFLNINGEEFPIVYNGTENFENVSALSDGFCRVTFKSKKGFIDKNRKLVIPVIYDDAGLYYDGRVGVKLNNKWGVIDKSGDIIMPIEYDKVDIYDLDKNITAIKNGKELYFDKTGKPIAKPKE